MKRDKKPSNYWTKERVFEESRNYKNKIEFFKGCPRAYEVARKNGWLKEMTWFTRPTAHNKKWTEERVFEEARKYTTRTEFARGNSGAYAAAKRYGLLDELFPKYKIAS